jgi:hypothetical protein
MDEGLAAARVIIARHHAPAPGKPVTVGKRIGEWVYELFITTLGEDRFLVEDVLDLYLGRGAFARSAGRSAMSKKIPTASVPTPSAGKSCGKSPVNGCGIYAST